MSDYIPAPDDDFDTYAVTKFGPYANAHTSALGITTGDLTALNVALIQWGYAWPGFINAESAFRAATEEKGTQRGALETAIRTIAGKVQTNTSVTDTQKTALGVTALKTTRTPVAAPTTTPAIQRSDTSTRAILRLFIVDAATPDSRAKPAGVQSCEIREQVGGTAPVDPNAMAFLAIETRMPYRADFDAMDIGKTVYFALRWLNTRGEPGPWSAIFNATIPS